MHEELRKAASSRLFTHAPVPYLMLTTDLEIVAVNDVYLTRTLRTRDDVVGRFLFDAFPDNPADPTADGVRHLGGSLERVLRSGRPDSLPWLRYDIPVPRLGGSFVRRTWAVLNSMLTDERDTAIGLLHHVEDITALADERGTPSARPEAESWAAPLAMAGTMARNRREQEQLRADHQRVADASVALAAQRGMDGGDDAARLRRRLWRGVIATRCEAGSRSWSQAVCRQVSAVMGPDWSAAVSAFDAAGRSYVLAASDTWAYELESLQEMAGEGPAVSARRARCPVVVADVRTHERWTVSGRLAAESAAAAVVSLPLLLDDDTVGAVTFFGRSAQLIDATRMAHARLLSDVAVSAMIIDATQINDPSQVQDGAEAGSAHGNDAAIATGILAVRLNVTPAEASVRLRARAFSTGRSLDDTARAVVGGSLHLE